jgi:NAD(P)-dependent dehydrogenase (short-subunit alcohol dehydrogenase family)
MIDVNLTGSFNAVRAVLPHMRPRKIRRIVLTASGLARQGQQTCGHYIATKWGILGLTKSTGARSGAGRNHGQRHPADDGQRRHDHARRDCTSCFARPRQSHGGRHGADLCHAQRPGHSVAVEPEASPGVLYLVSDEAANVTGGGMDVGAGWNARNSS